MVKPPKPGNIVNIAGDGRRQAVIRGTSVYRDLAVPVDRYEQQLHQILRANTWFMAVLRTVYDCALPDWFVGGGIIRSMTWDVLHGYTRPTPVPDVDVIFYDATDLRPERDQAVQQQLCGRLSDVPWDATNQAAVHLWYEHVYGSAVVPLHSSEEAISTWPETVTSIGVRLLANGALAIVAPFGLDDLFQMVLRRNPCRVSLEQFRQRVREKHIQQKWPRVRVIDG